MKTNTWLWIVQGLLAALFPVRGWREARDAGRGDAAGSGRLPGPFSPLHRRGRGLQGRRPDTPVGASHPPGVDPACRVGPDRHHDRRDRNYGIDRPGRAGADSDDRRGSC